MEIERTRGISVTSSALQFEYDGRCVNLLDTPGHEDFSEDTYRTLMAVDCAVMVLDAAKGVETQTRRLFEVCRLRQTPILTFINKYDQPGRDPIELLDEIERTLSIPAMPLNWPIGRARRSRACTTCARRRCCDSRSGAKGPPGRERDDGASPLHERRAPRGHRRRAGGALRREVSAARRHAAGVRDRGVSGRAPDAGVLRQRAARLRRRAVSPGARPPRAAAAGCARRWTASWCRRTAPFSAFVFKIQANMDRFHRDRMAFLRICSGQFTKDMTVHHARLKRSLRMTPLAPALRPRARNRRNGLPGDVVGVVNPGLFLIGDTVSETPGIAYPPMPAFQPSEFARLRCVDPSRRKQFDRGPAPAAGGRRRPRPAVHDRQRGPDPRRRRRAPVQHRREPPEGGVRRGH
jgi:peptide chain release factor 3